MSKKFVEFTEPSALITFILPSLSTAKSLSSPACLIFTGLDKPVAKDSKDDYNKRVEELIAKNSYDNKNMLIIDQGRSVDEKSVIYIENGIFKGLGFYDLNHQITNIKVLESIITPMENNRDSQHIIQSYMRRNKRIKTIVI